MSEGKAPQNLLVGRLGDSSRLQVPRGGLSWARRAAGCAPVGPPVGPPLGAVFRLKILFFSFFCSYLGKYSIYNIEIWYGGAPGVACHAPVERPDVRPSGRPWGRPWGLFLG